MYLLGGVEGEERLDRKDTMTKGELRKARKAAHANGQPLTGDLALPNQPIPMTVSKPLTRRKRVRSDVASREEQYGRYLDCGYQNWDDR